MKKYQGSYLSYFLMYTFYYLSLALFSGLISVYLMDQGYTATQVSFVMSCSLVVSMITQPFIGSLNDIFDKKKCNALLLSMTMVFSLLFIFVKNIYLIAMIYSMVIAIVNGTNPVIERMATLSRHAYGRIRIWGTIGYALGSQISGLLYQYVSPESMYFFYSLAMIFCVIGILGTYDVKSEKKKTSVKISFKDILWQKNMIVYLIIYCLFYGATNIHSTYLPAMLQHQGLSTSMTTMVLLISTLFELPVIFFSSYYMDRLSNKQLLMGVFILELVQFSTLAFVDALVIDTVIILLTKAVCTMMFIMINMKMIATIVDERYQMSALALVATFKSFITIFFQNIGGYLIDHTSYHIFYLFLWFMMLIAFVIVVMYPFPNNDRLKLYSE